MIAADMRFHESIYALVRTHITQAAGFMVERSSRRQAD